MAKWLGLTNKSKKKYHHHDFDLDISEDMGSLTAEITLNKRSLKYGKLLMDLPLPKDALVVLVKRENEYFIPKGKTEMKIGDKLLIITDKQETIDEVYYKLDGM